MIGHSCLNSSISSSCRSHGIGVSSQLWRLRSECVSRCRNRRRFLLLLTALGLFGLLVFLSDFTVLKVLTKDYHSLSFGYLEHFRGGLSDNNDRGGSSDEEGNSEEPNRYFSHF